MSDKWRDPSGPSEDDLAAFALDGHPDDVRTTLGLMVILAGFIDVLREFVGSPEDLGDPEKLIALARAWDGLDGEADVKALRHAAMILARRVQAIPRG